MIKWWVVIHSHIFNTSKSRRIHWLCGLPQLVPSLIRIKPFSSHACKICCLFTLENSFSYPLPNLQKSSGASFVENDWNLSGFSNHVCRLGCSRPMFLFQSFPENFLACAQVKRLEDFFLANQEEILQAQTRSEFSVHSDHSE